MPAEPRPAPGGASFRLAFLAAWAVISGAMLAAALLPWFVPQAALGSVIPECEWQSRQGRPCPLCGLTAAFYHNAAGEWRTASRANAASLPLYLFFWANGLAALGVLSCRSRAWRRPPASRAQSRADCFSLKE